MKILNKFGKIIKIAINKHISDPNYHQTTIVACFISSVIQFDIFFPQVVQIWK